MFDFKTISQEAHRLKTISQADFEKAWGAPFSDFVAQKYRETDFLYRELSDEEYEICRSEVRHVLSEPLTQAGEHRHPQWVKGWAENAEALEKEDSLKAIIPRYFEKIPVVRWRGRWILPVSKNFEFEMYQLLQYFVFDRSLRQATTLYEFGCGTAHNLLRARSINPTMKLVGLDWAESSQTIIRRIRERHIDNHIEGCRFDFFHPPEDFHLEPQSHVMTLAALEQTGGAYHAFLDFLLKERPTKVIHLEPIEELLDARSELDRLSINYFHKRNYLHRFLTTLKALEADGKIIIERADRTWVGSFFIEGYSLIEWRPV